MDRTTIILISVLVTVIIIDLILKRTTKTQLTVFTSKKYRKYRSVSVIFLSLILPTIALWPLYKISNHINYWDFINEEIRYMWLIYLCLLLFAINLTTSPLDFINLTRRIVKNFRSGLIEFKQAFIKERQLIIVVISGLLAVPLIKIIIHYFIYPKKPRLLSSHLNYRQELFEYGISEGEYYPLRYYLREVFHSELILFVPALIVFTLTLWFFWPIKGTNKV